MKERQRWKAEEDALLRAYVRQYGPREWNLVSQLMNTPLDRDAKSCLERWKNYLKPGIKKGSLTEEEQQLVIRLQAKHGNKWKKIAAEVPGRTAKRLGKWWEVFKEKQQREQKENRKALEPIDEAKYERILETFAEKLVKDRTSPPFLMAPPAPAPLPPWMATSNGAATTTITTVRPSLPSVTLTLSPSTVAPPPSIPWLQSDRGGTENPPPSPSLVLGTLSSHVSGSTYSETLMDCCRDLEEGHRALVAHKNEAAWMLRRVELQLESEKACRRRDTTEEIESKIRALQKEQTVALDRIDAEYREQLEVLRRDAEAKEQKLGDQWAAKHSRLTKLLGQMECRIGKHG